MGGSLEISEARVARALAKLAEGSYGVCDGCGEPIAPARLAAAPESVLCIGLRPPRALSVAGIPSSFSDGASATTVYGGPWQRSAARAAGPSPRRGAPGR